MGPRGGHLSHGFCPVLSSLKKKNLTYHKKNRLITVSPAIGLLKILGSEVPRSTAVLCTDSLVARPRGTKIRREVVLIRVLNSLGGNKDY